MPGKRSKSFAVAAGLLAIVLITGASASAAPVDALFQVRLAPGEPDASLNFGETLNLEVWMTLSSTGQFSDASLISFLLDLDAAENNLIQFNGDYVNDSGLPIMYTQGTDNAPVMGELARTVFSVMGGVSFGNGVPTRIGHLSVTSVHNGPGQATADYAFADDGEFREWLVQLVDLEPVNKLNGAPLTITLLPEPGAALMMAMAMGAASGLRRRRHR